MTSNAPFFAAHPRPTGCRSLLLAGLLAPLPALADPCDRLPPASVSIKRLDAPLSMNFDYSIRSLDNIAAAHARPGNSVLGLTRGLAVVRYELKLHHAVDASRRWECASPQITLHYGFSPITVYVAREFPRGTCAYGEILDHEQRHVEAYRQHARQIEPEILATLQQRFVGPPWRGPSGQAQARLQQELQARWIPYVTMLLNQVEASQGKIDTAEEYARIAGSCRGEIRDQLRRLR